MRLNSQLASFGIVFSSLAPVNASFNPPEYEPLKQTARCKGLNRKEGAVKDIDLRYVDLNDDTNEKETILMVHGWPGLWSSWSNQIQEFKDDYRLIIPDHRGFGNSTHPGDVKSSGTMGDLVGDLACILENAKVETAICMGHDWGSQLCYEAARMRPDLITAVIGIVVPYIPSAGPFTPVRHLVPTLPKLTYQLYFDTTTDHAVAELNKDIRRSLRATLRTVSSPPPDDYLKSATDFLEAYREYDEIPPIPFFTNDEEDYFVEQYAIQGFQNTLQFYTNENRYAGWKFANEQGNHTIPQPVLAVYPRNDPVANWTQAALLLKSADFTPHLTVKEMGGAHWAHIEFPEEFNRLARDWLSELRVGRKDATKEAPVEKKGEGDAQRAIDEL